MPIRQLPNRLWVIDGDECHPKWIEDAGRIDHDAYARSILTPLIRPGDTVIDVGAHWGTHAAFYREAVGQTGKVVAYEPNPDSYQCLIRNVPGILAYSLALGDRSGQESLCMHPSNAGASYLGGAGPLVRTVTLDEHSKLWRDDFDRITLIKIDAEGAEPEVLSGARRTLERHRPVLFIEVNPGALERRGHSSRKLQTRLDELNYRVEFFPPGSAWDSVQSDVLCRPD
jgi:FkbM family methyltransferase